MPLLRHWLGGASSISDGLDGPPEGDALTQWILGVVFPAIIGIGGVIFLIRQTYGFGTFVALLAASLHFHYFWGFTEEARLRQRPRKEHRGLGNDSLLRLRDVRIHISHVIAKCPTGRN